MPTREFQLIARYLPFYRSLHDGSRGPTTDAQRAFVRVASGLAAPSTPHEEAYVRYVNAGRCDGDEEDAQLEAYNREQDRLFAILKADLERSDQEWQEE